MKPNVNGISLAVNDIAEARRFYAEGLGWPVHFEQGDWVSFRLGNGDTIFGLLPRDQLAADAGVPAEGSGFRGFTLSYFVAGEDEVAEVLAEAERAGGTITKPAERQPWGGASGYFTDPDGYLWKVAAST
jgi:hypothetical protein